VYIVQCKDNFYYTGITNNLEKRLEQHNVGKDIFAFTYNRRKVTLKYFEHFTDVKQAIAREKQLKGWSRAKKEALINEDYNLLKELAKNRQHGNPSTSSG
jgi:putative endonuclease